MLEFSRLTQAYAIAMCDGNKQQANAIRAQIEAIPYETRLAISLDLYNRMVENMAFENR